MPQMSLYFDAALAKQVTEHAKKEQKPVSRYVADVLRERINDEWSPEFLACFGALKPGELVRPDQGDFADDAPRATLTL